MGTRNLTMVIRNGETKVAQYGQYDGYPSGQGKTILTFLRDVNLKEFNKILGYPKIKFIDTEKEIEIGDYMKSIGCTDEWMNQEQAKLFNEKYPFLSRNIAGNILDKIYHEVTFVAAPNDILLENGSDFAYSGFCDYGYVVDLDKNTFEVYYGYKTNPNPENERFYTNESDYLNHVKTYNLDNLPTDEEFIKDIDDLLGNDENEDDELPY